MDFAEARYYNPGHGRFTAVDPLRESAKTDNPQTWNRYVYVLNRPLSLVDPTGESPSTHIDENGKVITVIRDGDLGVYQHGNNADGKKPTEYMITKRQQKQGPSAGGTKIGETLYEDEFISPETGNVMTNTVIQVGKQFDSMIEQKHQDSLDENLQQIASESGNGGKYDVKVEYNNVGAQLAGTYATSRSAGNLLAGYNSSTSNVPYTPAGISFETFQKMAGALQVRNEQGKPLTKGDLGKILTTGSALGPAPYYGENYYQYRRSYQGWIYGKSNK